jgi:hypothetical protein
MGGRKEGRMDARTDRQNYRWLNGRMGESVVGQMYRRMEREESRQIYFFTICLTFPLSGSSIRII